jgi:DNA-binding beta-propeller fold protein YncE
MNTASARFRALSRCVVVGAFFAAALTGSTVAKGATPNNDRLALRSPWGVAVDQSSNDIYVVDSLSGRISKLSPSGTLLASWGKLGTARGSFLAPRAIAVDRSGTVYVDDDGNRRIQKLSSSGKVAAVWRVKLPLFARNGVASMAVDGRGQIYLVDAVHKSVRVYSPAGLALPARSVGNVSPTGIAIGARNTLIVSSPSGYGTSAVTAIQTISTASKRLSLVYVKGVYANGIAIDGHGELYLDDQTTASIIKVSPSGIIQARWRPAGLKPGSALNGIAVDGAGNIYVTDGLHAAVYKIDGSGQTVSVWK